MAARLATEYAALTTAALPAGESAAPAPLPQPLAEPEPAVAGGDDDDGDLDEGFYDDAFEVLG
jgi:putative transposase